MNPLKKDQDIVVQIAKDFKDIDISLPKLRKLVRTICNRFKLKATVSIAIVGDTQIRKLNRRFLNRNSTTDCLSFDLSDDERSGKLFELVVNAERAVREANRRGHSQEDELALYITHSLLHNLGFDDSKRAKAEKMRQTEDEILKQLGFGLVYNRSSRQSRADSR